MLFGRTVKALSVYIHQVCVKWSLHWVAPSIGGVGSNSTSDKLLSLIATF